MINRKQALPRRTFLRGMGVTLALPLLDAMIPAATVWAKTPANVARRLGFVFMPMGCDQSRWTPPGDKLDELSPILSSLAPVREQVTVISNMELQNAYPGSHATSNSSFLSAAKARLTESTDYYLGTTVDQIAARHIGQQTQLPSLELAMDLLDAHRLPTRDEHAKDGDTRLRDSKACLAQARASGLNPRMRVERFAAGGQRVVRLSGGNHVAFQIVLICRNVTSNVKRWGILLSFYS